MTQTFEQWAANHHWDDPIERAKARSAWLAGQQSVLLSAPDASVRPQTMRDLLSLLEKHGMTRAVFDSEGAFSGVWYIHELALSQALVEAGGFDAFIQAYVRERLARELAAAGLVLAEYNLRSGHALHQ